MIKSAKDCLDKFLNNLSNDSFLSKKILAEFNTNKDNDISNFYVIGDISFMIMGENITLSNAPLENELDSILSFCNFLGIYGIECVDANLPINKRHTMNLMVFNGEKSGEISNKIIKDSNIYTFADFCCKNFKGIAFENIYSYFARKINKSNSHIYYLQNGNKIISGALAADYIDFTYITFVATDKLHTKSGYARQIINTIISDSKKECILLCENNLVNFYEKLSFTKSKEIYLYTLRDENI